VGARRIQHGLAVGTGSHRPSAGSSIADRRAIERRHRQHAGHARRQERFVGRGKVLVSQQGLDRP
jgi:hypothetical protein